MADNARGIHVSPGIYSKETELTYAVKSLGITSLGVVGETLRGPAFQPMLIENWRDFQSVFGGTSPEKFLDSQYPKYELPYIAKSYLTESNQLQVCRVLGLSGYNAGPAWVLTANIDSGKKDTNEVYQYKSNIDNKHKVVSKTDAKKIKITVCPEYIYNGVVYDLTTQESVVGDENFHGVSSKVTVNIAENKSLTPSGVTENQTLSRKTRTVSTEKPTLSFTLSELETALNITGANTADIEVIVELTQKDGNKIDNAIALEKTKYNFTVYTDSQYNTLADEIKNEEYKINTNLIVSSSLLSSDNKMAVAVLRSRGTYKEYYKYSNEVDDCTCPQQVYDTLLYDVGEKDRESTNDCLQSKKFNMNALQITTYYNFSSMSDECGEDNTINGVASDFNVSSLNLGKFKLIGFKGSLSSKIDDEINRQNGVIDIEKIVENVYSAETEEKRKEMVNSLKSKYFEYSVSLNPSDKEYILKVLGTDPVVGESPIYVESLYDVALKQMIEDGYISSLSDSLTPYQVYFNADYCYLQDVNSVLVKEEESLSRKDVGKRFLADKNAYMSEITCHPYNYETKKPETDKDTLKLKTSTVEIGRIYTVRQYTDQNGKRHYYYAYYSDESIKGLTGMAYTEAEDKLKFINEDTDTQNNGNNSPARFSGIVRCASNNKYYRILDKNCSDVSVISCDLNNYRSSYRFASTPWIVSNVKGDIKHIELNKLFRFHTISDGNNANNEIKISIQNIKPDEGLFDVIIRSVYDTDESPIILERFGRCSLIPKSSNYISYKIGSYDGVYETKSKFVTVEVNETDATMNSVPAGFLGYPTHNFNGTPVVGQSHNNIYEPIMPYNLNYDEDIKNRKQYFGLSSSFGIDYDMFSYKGETAYVSEPENLTPGFHLDSRLDLGSFENDEDYPVITVDGKEGYLFDAVHANNTSILLTNTPIIGNEADMNGSIYEYVDLRKFTVCFYGGFDGWDVYRKQRSNTDNFRISKYKGDYNKANGEGFSFNRIKDLEALKLNQQGITSDFYAYLSAVRQFANPEEVDINVFATPGIDLINNKALSQEVIEMIEEERADSIYVATLPDKPSGANDYLNEMYTPDEIVYELSDTEIDSNYTCTYYPWIKYEDTDNNQYIYLPPTKDVVRNMAMTDNTTHPWFAPAGINRGDINCVRAHYVTKLSDEDILYDGRINPIKTFASDGVKVWGQKNLQIHESQLNRIAVRRLLLRMRKLIAISCIGLIFEPNDSSTKNKFLSTVTPILDDIRANRGISDYRIEVNDTIESRERRELPAKIYFKPYNALEYIDLDFILTPEGVSFDKI